MFKVNVQRRNNWKRAVDEYGYIADLMKDRTEPYWVECLDQPFAFQFDPQEIEMIYNATRALQTLCWRAVEIVVNGERSEQDMDLMKIPQEFRDLIRTSWNRTNPEDHYLYGRFDLAITVDAANKVKDIRALEYNADTPTFLCEMGHQWLWLEHMKKEHKLPSNADQFNSFDIGLNKRFKLIAKEFGLHGTDRILHFVGMDDAPEDVDTCLLLMAIAQSTGITTKFTPLREFGVDEAGYPVDQDNWRITHMFKLYPWENLFKEIKSLKTWGLRDRILDGSVKVIEPAWKALLSNKGIWPIMWREFPHSRHLLPSYFETDMSPEATALQTKIHVRKPIIGREGASVSIVDPDPRVGALVERPSPYGEEGYIVQEFLSPEKFGQYYAVIGSWYIDDTCGMAIRVDRELITGNRSIFVPHYIGSLHW